jgi:uncharacterized protein
MAGFVDSIAGGGGLISVPCLLSLGLPPHLALGTNKAQSVVGAVSSLATYAQKKRLTQARVPLGLLGGFVGGLLGARIVLWVRPEPLRPVMLALLFGAAVLAMLPRKQRASQVNPKGVAFLIAPCMGTYDGFFGPGTGSLLIIAFMTALGDEEVLASGNAKVVNFASNAASVLSFALAGKIIWLIALPMALFNACGAALGSRLAIHFGKGLVRAALITVLGILLLKLCRDWFFRS